MKTAFLFFLILFVSSCTVQKRHFRKGWTVNWNFNKDSRITDQTIEKKIVASTLIEEKLDSIQIESFESNFIEPFSNSKTTKRNREISSKDFGKDVILLNQAKTKLTFKQNQFEEEPKTKVKEEKKIRFSLLIGCVLFGMGLVILLLIQSQVAVLFFFFGALFLIADMFGRGYNKLKANPDFVPTEDQKKIAELREKRSDRRRNRRKTLWFFLIGITVSILVYFIAIGGSEALFFIGLYILFPLTLVLLVIALFYVILKEPTIDKKASPEKEEEKPTIEKRKEKRKPKATKVEMNRKRNVWILLGVVGAFLLGIFIFGQ